MSKICIRRASHSLTFKFRICTILMNQGVALAQVVLVCKADDRQDGVFRDFTPDTPGHLTAYCVRETAISGSFAFCLRREMKLYVIFALIDLLIVLVYPFVFIASKLRRFFSFKR